MPTLILPPRFTGDSIAVGKAALRAGWEVERLQNWRAPNALRGQNCAVYGEPLFVAFVAQELDLALLEPSLDWLANLPEEFRRREVQFCTLEEARKTKHSTFFKPADEKSFEAKIYASGADLPDLEARTPVLKSEIVSWKVEFRCFCLEGEVLTFSPYWRGDKTAQSADKRWPSEKSEEKAVLKLARAVLKQNAVPLPPAVVLDVGEIEGRGWAVVEVNPAFGSGIYGCDADEVLRVVARCCMVRSHLTTPDSVWVITRSEH